MAAVDKGRQDIDRTIENLLRLVRLGLSIPSEPLIDPNWEDILHLAVVQKLQGIVSPAADQSGAPLKLRETLFSHMIHRGIHTDQMLHEANLYVADLHEAGIDCLFLKGFSLRVLYPHPYMRQMSDIDLFVREEHAAKALQIAEKRGYSLHPSGIGDTSTGLGVPGVGLFELHTTALDSISYLAGDDPLYTDPWQFVHPDPQISPHGLFLNSPECFLFVVQHMAKHMEFYGAGLRMLLDVLLSAGVDGLDWPHLKKRLDRLCLKKFVDVMFAVGEKHLGIAPPAGWGALSVDGGTVDDALFYLFNRDNPDLLPETRTSVSVRRRGKHFPGLAYLVEQLFPPYRRMKSKYAYVRACPPLLPVAWVHRAVYAVVKRRKDIGEIIAAVFQDKGVLNSRRRMLSELGITELFVDMGRYK